MVKTSLTVNSDMTKSNILNIFIHPSLLKSFRDRYLIIFKELGFHLLTFNETQTHVCCSWEEYGAWGKLPGRSWKGSSVQHLEEKGSVSRWEVARNHCVQQELCRTKSAGECTGRCFFLRESNFRHSAAMRILLLRIHLLTGQHMEREPVLAWNTQPCNAFLHSQRLDPSKTEAECYNTPRCQISSTEMLSTWQPCEEQGGSHDTGPTKPPTFLCLSQGFCWLCIHVPPPAAQETFWTSLSLLPNDFMRHGDCY